MKSVAIAFTFYTDIIQVPDHIADNIKVVQHRFDQWLYDKSNDHGCWIVQDGKKLAVSFDTSDFVNYIRQYERQGKQAKIIQEGLDAPPDGMPSIWF